MRKMGDFLEKIRKNSITQPNTVSHRHSQTVRDSPPFLNRYATTQGAPGGDIGDNVSRHFLTNGWAECGSQGDTLNIPGYQLNEHEIGGDKSRVRRATQVYHILIILLLLVLLRPVSR